MKREAGEIAIEDGLRSLLSHLRALEGVDVPAELEVEAVRDVERGLGARLPASVLAIFAARLPFLEKDKEMSLAKVIGNTGRVRSLGAPGDLVGIGKERGNFICLEKGVEGTAEVRLTLFDEDEKSKTKVMLPEWLEAVKGEREALLGDALDPGSPEPSFVPTIVRRLPAGSPGMQVMHETFGPGKVLREIGMGPNRKVQVDFPGRGLKLIQARFLRWLE